MHASEIYRWDKTDMLGVTKCIEIAMRCVEDDRDKRPSIKDIMGELNELESTMEEILKEDPKPLIRQLVQYTTFIYMLTQYCIVAKHS